MSKFIILIVLTLVGAFGSYYLKLASSKADSIVQIFFRPYIYIGGILYLISIGMYIVVLKELPYSIVLPMTSITYIWSLLIASYLLKENITRFKLLGALFIVLGSVIIGLSGSF